MAVRTACSVIQASFVECWVALMGILAEVVGVGEVDPGKWVEIKFWMDSRPFLAKVPWAF
jgi:hypothetical protein